MHHRQESFKTIFSGIFFRALILAILFLPVVYLGTPALAQEDDGAEEATESKGIKELYQDFNSQLKDRNYREAEKTLKAMEKLSGRELIWLYEKMGYFQIQELMERKEFRKDLESILEKTRSAKLADARSEDNISALVEALTSGDEKTKVQAYFQLTQLGQYSVPAMLPHISEVGGEIHMRAAVNWTLKGIGRPATLPLIAALDTKNDYLKMNILSFFEVNRQTRAIARLKEITEDRSESKTIRDEATRLLKLITRRDLSDLEPAHVYYYKKARRYYIGEPRAASEAQAVDGVVWKMRTSENGKEKLVFTKYRPAVYQRIMAIKSCERGLRIAPDYLPLRGLLICSIFSYQAAVEADLAWVNSVLTKIPEGHEKRAEFETYRDKIQEERKSLRGYLLLARLFGETALYRALEQAMVDHRDDVAQEIISFLGNVASGIDLPRAYAEERGGLVVRIVDRGAPLLDALKHEKYSIRITAAIALAKINPPQRFLNDRLVVPTLAKAAGELPRPAIMLIEPNREENYNITIALEKAGFIVYSALTGREGLIKIHQYPSKDAVVISSRLFGAGSGDLSLSQMIESLKKHPRTGTTPITLVHYDTERKMEFLDKLGPVLGSNKLSFLVKPVVPGTAKFVINKSLKDANIISDNAQKSKAFAEQSLVVMSQLDPKNTIFPLQDAEPTLMGLLNRDDIRTQLQAVQMLGKLKAKNSVLSLSGMLTKKPAISVPLKITVLQALGQIRSPQAKPAIFALILTEKDETVLLEAARTLGFLGLSVKEISAAMRELHKNLSVVEVPEILPPPDVPRPPQAPVILLAASDPAEGKAPLSVEFTGTAKDPDGRITKYEWDFEGDGTFDWVSASTGKTSHNYIIAGNYQAVFRVTDNSGMRTETRILVRILGEKGEKPESVEPPEEEKEKPEPPKLPDEEKQEEPKLPKEDVPDLPEPDEKKEEKPKEEVPDLPEPDKKTPKEDVPDLPEPEEKKEEKPKEEVPDLPEPEEKKEEQPKKEKPEVPDLPKPPEEGKKDEKPEDSITPKEEKKPDKPAPGEENDDDDDDDDEPEPPPPPAPEE